MKSGFVTIIGRPNVGKSTLLNQILGQKIVITTDKAQTTRKRIKGIYTTKEGQIVFVDTPGVHKPLNKLGEFLLDEAKISIPDADLILFLVDGSEPAGKGDKWIAQNLLETEVPVIIVMNKVDKVKKPEKVEENLISYKTLFEKNLPIVRVSARSVAEEVIREKILLNTSDEIPHSVAVKIEKYQETDEIDRIYANIFCETKSQKGILIGKGGAMLKKIGTEARLELEKIVEKKVFLGLEVKVEKDWRKKEKSLKNFGYEQEK
ncbi:GTPase Era [bacterium]|nr:GTPase Era [bacterium]